VFTLCLPFFGASPAIRGIVLSPDGSSRLSFLADVFRLSWARSFGQKWFTREIALLLTVDEREALRVDVMKISAPNHEMIEVLSRSPAEQPLAGRESPLVRDSPGLVLHL